MAPRHYRNDVAPGVFGVFAYWGAAAAFGQEQSVVAAESGRSTFELSGGEAVRLELLVRHFAAILYPVPPHTQDTGCYCESAE